MSKTKFYLESLGCAKNTVDSNSLSRSLIDYGYEFIADPQKADILIVNTCGFIKPARDEAIDTLNELAKNKKASQRLFAVGCMAEQFADEIKTACPTVEKILGINQMTGLLDVIEHRQEKSPSNWHGLNKFTSQYAVEGASAYIKIADGCSRRCAFCRIPLIKGEWQSRPQTDILKDAFFLQCMKIKELILIAQDTSSYGVDKGEKDALPELLRKIVANAPDIPWVRLMYAFPGRVSDSLIDTIAEYPSILPYIDIPLQHAHPDTLRRMRRPDNMNEVRETIHKLRTRIPGISIRSTFITGFPGETETEFETLLDFIEEMRFDRVGVFPFYSEEGTPAAALADDVPQEIKIDRANELMEIQQAISSEINQGFIGKKMDVLIEGASQEEGYMVGRSYRDAPEIDGFVFVKGSAVPGQIVSTRITSAMEYDLLGEIEN